MKYKQMLKIRKTEKDPQVRDRILLNVLVIRKRDGMSVTKDRALMCRASQDRALSGHGPVMGRQVAQPVPEGGHCRPADSHPLRPPTEDLRRDPEGR